MVLLIEISYLDQYDVLYERYRNFYGDENEVNEEITDKKLFRTNAYYDKNSAEYVMCSGGKTTEILSPTKIHRCTGCSIFHRYEQNTDGFMCISCENKMIASTSNNHKNKACDISYDRFRLTQIYFDNNVKECNDLIINSVGRDQNTPPIINFCQCPNNMPRVEITARNNSGINEKLITCLEIEEANKIIDNKALDYAVINTVETIDKKYIYRNCNPNREDYYYLNICLCPPKYIFIDSICKKCTEMYVEDSETENICTYCPADRYLSLDGNSCMCPYSDKPTSKDCKETPNNSNYCSGNLVVINKKCQICPDGLIKSSIDDICICLPGKFKNNQNQCLECPIGTFSSLKNPYKCTKCSLFMTTVSPNSSSKSECNKILYLRVFIVIVSIILGVSLVCVVAYFVFKKKISKITGKSVQRNNQSSGYHINKTTYNHSIDKNKSAVSDVPDKNLQTDYLNYELAKINNENMIKVDDGYSSHLVANKKSPIIQQMNCSKDKNEEENKYEDDYQNCLLISESKIEGIEKSDNDIKALHISANEKINKQENQYRKIINENSQNSQMSDKDESIKKDSNHYQITKVGNSGDISSTNDK
ncbi:MAG: hypothetical protein MHPSP_001180 [Paramarteilia canceri]